MPGMALGHLCMRSSSDETECFLFGAPRFQSCSSEVGQTERLCERVDRIFSSGWILARLNTPAVVRLERDTPSIDV